MAYKSKKVATCPCGTGDTHSLRQAGICDGIRVGHLSLADGQRLIEACQQTKEKRQQAQRDNPNAEAPSVQPESEV
jgi:hypothetical protein